MPHKSSVEDGAEREREGGEEKELSGEDDDGMTECPSRHTHPRSLGELEGWSTTRTSSAEGEED